MARCLLEALDGVRGAATSFSRAKASRSNKAAFRYAAAILLAALAQAVRLPLRPPTLVPYITYVPAILLAAGFGGLGPGLLSTALCSLESIYSATKPLTGLRAGDLRHWLGAGTVALTGVAVSVVFERLKRTEALRRAACLELATVNSSAPEMLLVVDDAFRVRKANDRALQFANKNVPDLTALGPGEAIGCLNSLADPDGCGYGPACGECAIRAAVLDTLRNGTRHHGVEARTTKRGTTWAECAPRRSGWSG